MSVISLPAAALASCSTIRFEMVRSQEVLRTISGIAQVTSFPDRRWTARLSVVPQFGSALMAWSLVMDQISDLSNVFALGPPHYTGPSSGYAGANPLVDGADQLGLSLVVDGVTPSAQILSAGDYLSFDTTSAWGNTNRQLNRTTANVTADGSGQATIPLLYPIREAPADDATVQIKTPTAFFNLTTPRSAIDLQPGLYSTFEIDAEERIFP